MADATAKEFSSMSRTIRYQGAIIRNDRMLLIKHLENAMMLP
jgi:hypothetical protein